MSQLVERKGFKIESTLPQKKKTKEKKSQTKITEQVKIIDDDAYIPWSAKNEPAAKIIDEEIVSVEDAPIVVGIVDERPSTVQEKERFKDAKRWKTAAFEVIPEPGSIGPQPKSQKTSSRSRQKQNASDDSDPELDRDSTRKNGDADLSPPRRRTQQKGDDDPSPPRRRRQQSEDDPSPPRKRNYSPPRRKQSKDNDPSPPRRRDASPPRRKQPRDDDPSPPRKRDSSPPRRKQPRDDDPSPPRRRDASPPRRKQPRDDDPSPPRRKQPKDDDPSPPRRRDRSSPSHRRNDRHSRQDSPPSSSHRRQPKNEPSSPPTHRRLKQESPPPSIQPAKSERRRLAEHKEQVAERYAQWGRGIAQVRQTENAVKDYLEQSEKPLARYRDDEDLDAMLKEREREDDPMLKYLTKKSSNTGDRSTNSNSAPVKPRYKGPDPQKNRFDIWPGYRWDGVDRSNGYEKKLFETIANRHAKTQEAYLWSVEDM